MTVVRGWGFGSRPFTGPSERDEIGEIVDVLTSEWVGDYHAGMVMTRDLIETILKAAEGLPPGNAREMLVNGETILKGSDLEEAAYYCRDSGYIELWDDNPNRFGGTTSWLVKRLTASGHNKLRELRGQEPL